MPITVDKLVNAMATNSSRLVIDKASIASQVAGQYCSMWRGTGQPAQGAIPSTAATCNATTTGGFSIPAQTSPVKAYITYLEWACSNNSQTLELHDRLAHMGGLSGTVTTAQTVGIDLNTMGATDNISARIGDTDYSDVQWWLEWYTATGSTAVNAAVNVTYSDGSTGNLSTVALAASRGASTMTNLNVYRPAASTLFIRGINSVTLSATTGTAGSFGVTATRLRGSVYVPIANIKVGCNWADLPINEIPQSACPFLIVLPTATSSGTVRGGGKVSFIDPT